MKTKKIVFMLTLFILLVVLTQSISFNDTVKIEDYQGTELTSARSEDNIYCRWNASSDTISANITWYKNYVQFGNIITLTYPGLEEAVIDKTELNEEDTWNCTVRIFNGTNYDISSDTVYVDYDPLVYIQNITGSHSLVTNNYTIIEDQNYSVIWNTTESTQNNYELVPSDGMCTEVTDGTATCSPSNNYLSDPNVSNTVYMVFRYNYNTYLSSQGNSINFTVLPVNDVPSLSLANENSSIDEDEFWLNTLTIADEEGNFPMNLTVEEPSFCSHTPNTAQITTSTVSFNCSLPGPTKIGNYTINITASDNPPSNGFGLIAGTTNTSFNLEVKGVNHQPNITYTSNLDAQQNEFYNLTINVTDLYDNNTINFSITSNCNEHSITNPWNNIRLDYYNVTFNALGDPEVNMFTTYASGVWNGTLTNDQIVCRNITITVEDKGGLTDSVNSYLNISNVNDNPVIFNFSRSLDVLGNTLINNLTGYEGAPLLYQINGSDPDLLVLYDSNLDSFNESIYYSTNETSDTWIKDNFNNLTGLINISSENMNRTGNFSVMIIMTDSQNATDQVELNVEIFPNQIPYFNQTLNKSCFEKDNLNYNYSCYLNLSFFAKDNDTALSNDYVANFSEDSPIFNISENGILNFSPSQNVVGEHVINVTITDSRGAINTKPFYLYINNTNDKPIIGTIQIPTPPNALYFEREINNEIAIPVIDEDLSLNGTTIYNRNYAYENITINWSNNNNSQDLSLYITINQTGNSIIINTSMGIGEYNITISATDNYFNYTGEQTYDNDSTIIVFRVYNITSPPVITNVTPYGIPWSSATMFNWKNISSDRQFTRINLSENMTVTFNKTVSDENPDNLTYQWYYDNSLITNSSQVTNNGTELIYYFNFFQAGFNETESHNLTLVVTDGIDNTQNDTFVWIINVTDLNRPVVLNAIIPNISVEGSRNPDNKDLWSAGYSFGFYDPDFDYNEDGLLGLTENFTLTYNVSDRVCDGYAIINVSDTTTTIFNSNTNSTLVSGHGIRATASNNGTCYVNFTASDGQYSAISNNVFINVTVLGSEGPQATEVTQRSGTRTIIETETVTVPVVEEIEKPIPINVVLPDMVTVYENDSIKIPLTVTNTWNYSVSGIKLDYEINGTYNYTVKFSRQNFYRIEPGEEIKTQMIVEGYRVGGIYEMTIIATVTDPPYEDKAKIYLNSIEQTSTGAEVKTLIKFAQDLLHKNKECQELEEILTKAQKTADKGELKEAIKMLHSMINGCKYLISQEQRLLEEPKILRQFHLAITKDYITYLLGLAVVIVLGFGAYALFRKN